MLLDAITLGFLAVACILLGVVVGLSIKRG